MSLIFCATGGCKEGSWTLWNAYSARFIDAQGRVIDPQGDQHTTSEGQAYAMFFALADNDRACFDRLLAWTQANLANNDLRLIFPHGCGAKTKTANGRLSIPTPASDADVWMAYTLVEAGRLWNNRPTREPGPRHAGC